MTAKSAVSQSERIQKRFQRMLGAGLVTPANEPGAAEEAAAAAPAPSASAEESGSKTHGKKKRGGARFAAFMGSAP
jgi:hypothetical protein